MCIQLNCHNIFVILILFTSTALILYSLEIKGVEGSVWKVGESMPTNRSEIAAEVVKGKIYVMGGGDYSKDGILDLLEIYDPITNEWTQGTPLPYGIDHAPSVKYEDKIYLIGGFLRDKITTDKVQIYDPITNEWTQGTALPVPRAASVAEIVNGTIYVISGLDIDHHPVTTNLAYNIENDTWMTKAQMPTMNGPKHHAASAVVDGKIYVIGGRLFGNGVPNQINDALTNLDDNWMYNPQKNNWTLLSSMPIGRSGFAAESLDGQIYVFGGQVARGPMANVESYDPIINKWTVEPKMKFARDGLTAVTFNDRIYVLGGQHEELKALGANEILDPTS